MIKIAVPQLSHCHTNFLIEEILKGLLMVKNGKFSFMTKICDLCDSSGAAWKP